MKQIQFENKYNVFWDNFTYLVNDLEKNKKNQKSNLLDRYEFPKQYREI